MSMQVYSIVLYTVLVCCLHWIFIWFNKGSSIKDVRSEGGRGVGSDADKCRQGGGSLIACGRPQVQTATQLGTCLPCWQLYSCMVVLITSTVTALDVLNGPLRSLDVCCLWLLGLRHAAHASVTWVSHKPSTSRGPRPTHCFAADCNVAAAA